MAWREFIGHMKASLIAQKQAVDMSSSMHGIKEKLTAKTVVEIFFFFNFFFPTVQMQSKIVFYCYAAGLQFYLQQSRFLMI